MSIGLIGAVATCCAGYVLGQIVIGYQSRSKVLLREMTVKIQL